MCQIKEVPLQLKVNMFLSMQKTTANTYCFLKVVLLIAFPGQRDFPLCKGESCHSEKNSNVL